VNRVRFFCTLLLALSIAVPFALSAPPNRRRGNQSHNYAAVRARQQQALNNAATAQLNAAKQLLAASQAKGSGAQAKLDAALSKLREEATKFHDAQSTTRQAAKELAEIEQEILDEQKDDSPYAKAAKTVEAARAKLQQIEDRILSDPKVQIELTGLSGAKLAESRESVLKLRTDWLEAKAALEMEAAELARTRSALFQADEQWKEAAEALSEARKDENAAEQMTHSGTSGRIGLNSKIKDASEAAAVARAAIAQAEAIIKRTTPNKNQPQNSKSKNQPKKK